MEESMEADMEESVEADMEDSEDSYIFEKEQPNVKSEQAQPVKSKGKQKDQLSEEGDAEEEDHYRMDPFLVRRESTLLLLVLKSFRERVIIFCNEKKQCNRLHTLFSMFGLKAVQV